MLLTNRKECLGNNFAEFNKIKDSHSFTDKSELEEILEETDRAYFVKANRLLVITIYDDAYPWHGGLVCIPFGAGFLSICY